MRYLVLDLVRSIAIVLVMIAHIGQTIRIPPEGRFFGIPGFYYVTPGGLGVTIFLILSGAVLELRYRDRRIGYLSFIGGRCRRIYPVYYMSLVVGISLQLIKAYRDTGTVSAGWSSWTISDAILSLTGLYAFAGRWGGPFLSTSWFIGLIMSMYLLYPILSNLIRRRPHTTVVVLLLVSTLVRLLPGKCPLLAVRPLDWFPLCRVFEFSAGVYLATILPASIWGSINSVSQIRPLITFISRISFPLFLVHYPLRFLILYLTKRGINRVFSIFLYVLLSVMLSWILLVVDEQIFNKLFRSLGNFGKRGEASYASCQ